MFAWRIILANEGKCYCAHFHSGKLGSLRAIECRLLCCRSEKIPFFSSFLCFFSGRQATRSILEHLQATAGHWRATRFFTRFSRVGSLVTLPETTSETQGLGNSGFTQAVVN